MPLFKTLLRQPIATHHSAGHTESSSRVPGHLSLVPQRHPLHPWLFGCGSTYNMSRRFPDRDPAELPLHCQLDVMQTHLRDRGTPLGCSERIIKGERPALTVESNTPKSRQNKVGRRTAVERLPSSLSDPWPTECALLHPRLPR